MNSWLCRKKHGSSCTSPHVDDQELLNFRAHRAQILRTGLQVEKVHESLDIKESCNGLTASRWAI